MPEQQRKQKGGRKLRRTSKHKSMYAAQFFRTARNKAAAKSRIARRKKENPNLKGKEQHEKNDQTQAS